MAGHPVSHAHDGADGSGTILTPPIALALKGYWDADTCAGADATAIATWHDDSGRGNDLLQATGGNKPLVYSNVLNGHRILRSDGSKFMRVTYAAPLVQPIVNVIVSKLAGVSAALYYWDGATSGGRNALLTSGSAYDLYAGTELTGGTENTSWHIIMGIYNGSSSKVYVDGGSAVASGNAGTTGPDGITFGCNNGGTQGVQSDTACFMSLQGITSLAALNPIGKYLADKYALTWTTAT